MTSLTSDAPDIPESFSTVLDRLTLLLAELRHLRATVTDEAGSASGGLPAFSSWIDGVRRAAHGLKACGQAPLAQVLAGCAAACERLQAVPSLHGQDALEALERALAAVRERAEQPCTDAVAQAVEMFSLHRAVQHLAGADRVHPADLWPGAGPWRELDADPFTGPRAVDAAAREALEAALLALMRQPRADDFQRMSDLCAALGEGTAAPQASVWKLASAVYEAQAQGRLTPDVYLKRLGPRLLALTRLAGTGFASVPSAGASSAALDAQPAPAGAGPLSETSRLLAHELLFFCHRAWGAQVPVPSPRLARFAAAYGLTHESVEQAWPQEELLDPPLAQQRLPEPSDADPASASGAESVTNEEAPPTVAVPEEEAAPPTPTTEAEVAAPAAARGVAERSLAEAVPGLPSAADLDFSSWTLAANADQAVVPEDEVKVIGPLRLDIPAFNTFLNDADEDSRQLATALAEWALEPSHPLPSEALGRATALAQGAARVGHQALAGLAGALAQALREAGAAGTFAAAGQLPFEYTATRLLGAAEEIRRLLHQFAAGFLTEPSSQVLERLAEIGSVALVPIGPAELRYLQGVAQAQTSAAQALQRLEACRPSALAGLPRGAEVDAVFEAAWAQAAQDLQEAQRLVGTVLAGLGNPPR